MAKRVIVAGAGVIGAFTAYSLAKDGWQVTLIDQAKVGSGSSHGNCGYICPSHALPLAVPGAISSTIKTFFQKNSPLKLHPWAVLSRLSWFLGFARKCNTTDMLHSAEGISALLNTSRTLYEQVLHQEKIQCEWERQGLLFVFQTAKAFEHYQEIDALLTERFQQPAKRLAKDELTEFEPALKPGAAAGGYWYAGDSHLRPDVLMSEMHRVLKTLGVTVTENCRLQDIVREREKIKAIRTTQGELSADAFVVALGAWSPQLNKQLGCQLPIVPGKGYSLTVPRPRTCPRVPIIFEEHRVAVTPFQSGFRVGSTMEFAGYNDTLNPKRIDLLVEAARHYLPDELPTQDVEQWWGWRPMVYDGNPIIDFAPETSNLIIAAGHGMLGLSQAPGTGQLVAELLGGISPHIDPAPYSLARFR